jgi:predicted dehydrogenase
MGLVGPGFIATHHIDAVRRLGHVEVLAIAGSTQAAAESKARAWHIPRAYGDYRALLADPEVRVVHNTTPNHLHFAVTLAALRAGKHVIADKPLARTREESRALLDAARAAGVAHAVTFNYRGNPLIQQARSMVASGEIGAVSFVHGHYLQDWMTDANVYSWRSDPERGGVSSALGDIGSHWCDLVEHVTGLRIQAVLADFATVVPVRHSAGTSAEAFQQASAAQRTRVDVRSEDVASVLLRFENGAKGSFCVGQVLPGHKNDLRIEVCGRSFSLRWEQERPAELWIGAHDRPNQIATQDPASASAEARRYTRLPPGHQQGWADAFANVIADAYEWIGHGGTPETKPPALASFDDGYRSSCLIDAMVKSAAAGGVWQPVE